MNLVKMPDNAPARNERLTQHDHDLAFWRDASADDFLIHHHGQTAIYWNRNGDVVIRQAQEYDHDALVVLDVDLVPRLIAKLTELLAEVDAPEVSEISETDIQPVPSSSPDEVDIQPAPSTAPAAPKKDRTNAERQRRYRQRHRNAPPLRVTASPLFSDQHQEEPAHTS